MMIEPHFPHVAGFWMLCFVEKELRGRMIGSGTLLRNVGLSQPVHSPHNDDRQQRRRGTPSPIDIFDIHSF